MRITRVGLVIVGCLLARGVAAQCPRLTTTNAILSWSQPLQTFTVLGAGADISCTPHTFFWDFGDGTTITTMTRSVVHSFAAPGTYTVSVQLSGLDTVQLDGTMTLLLTRAVTISPPIPVLNVELLALMLILLAIIGCVRR